MAKYITEIKKEVVETITTTFKISDTLSFVHITKNGKLQSQNLTTTFAHKTKYGEHPCHVLVGVDMDYIKTINPFKEYKHAEESAEWSKKGKNVTLENLDEIDFSKVVYMCYATHRMFDHEFNEILLPLKADFSYVYWDIPLLKSLLEKQDCVLEITTDDRGYCGVSNTYGNMLVCKYVPKKEWGDFDSNFVSYGALKYELGIADAYHEYKEDDEVYL